MNNGYRQAGEIGGLSKCLVPPQTSSSDSVSTCFGLNPSHTQKSL